MVAHLLLFTTPKAKQNNEEGKQAKLTDIVFVTSNHEGKKGRSNLKIILMKNIHHFYWLFLLFALSGFTNQKKEIKVTSLGNCGYLYKTWNSEGVKRITDPQPRGR